LAAIDSGRRDYSLASRRMRHSAASQCTEARETPSRVPPAPASETDNPPEEIVGGPAGPPKKDKASTFFDSVIAKHIVKLESLQPKVTAEQDDRSWDRVFERVLLPRKVARLEKELRIHSMESNPLNKAKPLTQREERIWAVIRNGSTGPQYCRELGNAKIAPRRSGVWRDCPRTYISAYKQGEPWCHRIQDEKSKIRRKAELAGLASE
jgi:hypothetical protein